MAREAQPIVGRSAEIAYLEQCLETALTGERQVVFVSGEPGIGKTTIVDMFLERIKDKPNLRVGHGQCVEQYGAGEAFMPLLEIAGQLCRGPERDQTRELLRRYAPSWLVQLPFLIDTPELETLHRQLPGATRERMLREAAEILAVFTARQGLVLVFEDLHWSDVSTLEWLSYIAQRREPAKLLIIGTYRPTEVLATNHPLRGVVQELIARRRCEELRVTPLSEQAVSEYLTTRLGASLATSPLPGLIHRRTGGNPLFVINVVDDLLQQGVVCEDAGQWHVRGDSRSVTASVPDTLRQVIERQVERLPAAVQQLFEVASIVGVEFSAAAVAAGLQAPVEEVDQQCETLARREQFIMAQGTEEWPDGTLSERYRFRHALYHAVLYDRLTETQRVRLHRRIAEHKEGAYGTRAGAIAAELAVHFERGRDLTRAAQYLGKAVENAVCRSAHQEAIEQLATGLAVVARLPENHRPQQELVLNLRLGVSLSAIRGYTSPEVQQAYARALEISQRLEQTPQLFPALWGLWLYYEQKGELLRAKDLADRLLAVAQQQDDPILLIQAHHAVGGTNFFRGAGDLARSHLEQGMACYHAHKQHLRTTTYVFEPGVGCLGMLATTLWMLGYADQALTRSREAVEIARAADHRSSLAHALRFAAFIHHLRGEPQATQEYATAAVTISTESGFSYWFALGTMLQGWAQAEQGKHDEGQATFLRGLSILRTIGTRVGEPLYLSILAGMYRETNQIEQGLSTLAEAFTFAEASGIKVSTAELYRLKGELTLSTVPKFQILDPSSHAEAEACFLKALEVAQQQHAKSLELRASMSLARLWQLQGKSTEARELLEGIYNWFSEGFDTKDLQEAEALLVTLGGKVKTENEKRPKGRMDERANGREENDSRAVPFVSSSRPLLPSLTAPRPETSDAGPRTPDAMFRDEGNYWTITFSGTTCRVRDTLGMHYLAQLLRHPHEEVHALTLAADEPLVTKGVQSEDGSNEGMRRGFTDAGEILDPHARVAYRQRLRDLREELEEAQSFNDSGRIEKLQDEIEFLTQELAQAVGLGGQSRKAASVAERARINVTKRIKIALRKISEQHPTLGAHLTQTIRTGTFCVYTPSPYQPVTWQD